jgi:negative regulator of replication initiation
MSDKTTIEVSREIRDWIASLGSKGESNDTILKRVREVYKTNKLTEAVVDQWGKASISRTKAGQTIEYRIKPKN